MSIGATMNPSPTAVPVILYHANCDDGFGAAYAAWESLGNEADYRAVHHGDTVTVDDFARRDIYILDFSYEPTVLRAIAAVAKSVTVLDHHKSAAAQWQDAPIPANATIVFDMARSGAQMAWDFFHPGRPRPQLIEYIGDRDLWQFALPDSREFSAGLQLVPIDFSAWQHIDVASIVETGRTILAYQRRQVESSLNKPLREVTIGGHRGLAINAIANTSELGHALALKSGTFGMTFFVKDDDVVCSLRSVAPFDVSEIAKSFGGGGHAQAAGFRLTVVRFFGEIW